MLTLHIPDDHRALLAPIRQLLAARGVAGWLVGGYVRDLLLNQPRGDIDIAVDGPAVALARELADRTGGAFVLLDAATETARIVWKTTSDADQRPPVVDLVRLRAPTIDMDVRLRDLTINALALPLDQLEHTSLTSAVLLDPTSGRADLQARRIRLCGPTALIDDPLRLLRAVRFAAQLDFEVMAETDAELRRHVQRIDGVAQERIRDELLKLLAARHAAPWLAYLDDLRLLTRIIPELDAARDCEQPKEHFLPVLAHLFEMVCAWEWLYAQLERQAMGSGAGDPPDAARPFMLPAAVRAHPQLTALLPNAELVVARMQQPVLAEHRRYALFKLAALLHDVAKPPTKHIREDGRVTFYDHQALGAEIVGQIGQRLRLNRDGVAYLRVIVGEHMRPGQLRALGPALTRRAIYRLLRDTGDAAPDVLLHALCDHLAARGPHLSVAAWRHHVAWTGVLLTQDWAERRVAPPTRLITGADVIRELGIEPGPVIGRILAAVQEAQFLGEVETRTEALALAAQVAQMEQ